MSPIPTAKQLVYLLRVTPFGKLSQSNQAHCQNSSSNRNTQDILSGQSAKKESHESRNTNRNSVGDLRHNMDDMVAGSTAIEPPDVAFAIAAPMFTTTLTPVSTAAGMMFIVMS